jgi:hypothetical protein
VFVRIIVNIDRIDDHHCVSKRQTILKGQPKIGNPEKLATLGTQDTRRIQIKQNHNTICVGHHYT